MFPCHYSDKDFPVRRECMTTEKAISEIPKSGFHDNGVFDLKIKFFDKNFQFSHILSSPSYLECTPGNGKDP